jgi:hypothetical protein
MSTMLVNLVAVQASPEAKAISLKIMESPVNEAGDGGHFGFYAHTE